MPELDKFDDPDDYFKETRMSFGDHIEELRRNLLRALYGFFVAVILAFPFGWYVMDFIKAPVIEQLDAFYDRRVKEIERKLKEDPEFQKQNQPQAVPRLFVRSEIETLLGRKLPDNSPLLKREQITVKDDNQKAVLQEMTFVQLTLHERPFDEALRLHPAMQKLGRRPGLITLSIQEAFFVFIKVCLVTGFVLASPWVFYQIWSFIAAGLYPHEKRLVNVYLPVSLGLFIIGVLVCQFLVMPQAVYALLWFNEFLGLEPDLRLNEWLGFAILMPVLFGLAFQTPLIMLMLERIGIATVQTYRNYRKVALMVLVVVCAVITPSTDPWSLLFLFVPIAIFYELGIWLCLMSPGRPLLDLHAPESEEMVEV